MHQMPRTTTMPRIRPRQLSPLRHMGQHKRKTTTQNKTTKKKNRKQQLKHTKNTPKTSRRVVDDQRFVVGCCVISCVCGLFSMFDGPREDS